MDTILKQNDELIANLLKIQKSKLYEMHKYEQIMNMPAKNVHAYLKKEFEKPTKVLSKEEEFQEIVERERAKVKNEAAKVIQRNVSEVCSPHPGGNSLKIYPSPKNFF